MFVTNSFCVPSLKEPYERTILLRNTLNVPVVFKIRQSCQLSLKISPTIGIVSGKSKKLIKIQYMLGFKKLVNNQVPKHFDIFVRFYNINKERIIYKWLKNEISEPNHLAHRFVIEQKTGYISPTFVFDIPCKASILEPVLFPSDDKEDDNCKTAIQIDEGTETANKILQYPKELLYHNNINHLHKFHLNENEREYLGEFNHTTYSIGGQKNVSNGIIDATINFLFGQKNDSNESTYTYRSSSKRYGFIC